VECQDQESLFKMEVDLLVPANVQAGGSLFRDAAKSSNIWPGFLVIFFTNRHLQCLDNANGTYAGASGFRH